MAYCTNCGTQDSPGQRFCVVCGTALLAPTRAAAMPAVRPVSSNEEAQVLIGISLDPPRQARWSVFLRLILALPLFVVLFFIAIAGFFATIAAWFAALFTKRVPEGIQRFLTKVLRFHANLLAYEFLLTPRWPGITLNERANDQVLIEVDHADLRRSSVFFRCVLAFPAGIVGQALSLGSYPILLVMWIWGIVVGRESRTLHQALALVMRYQVRYLAYACLLTPTQPFKGFLGDGEEQKADQLSTLTAGSRPTRWGVIKSGRVMVVIALLLSVPIYALQIRGNDLLLTPFKSIISRALVDGSNIKISAAINQFDSSVSTCQSSTSPGCMSQAARDAYNVLLQQSSVLNSFTIFPSDVHSQLNRYELSIDTLESELLQVEDTKSVQAQLDVIDNQFQTTIVAFDSSYIALKVKLAARPWP